MRLVVQRVKKAAVSADGKRIGMIGPGLFVLVGVSQADNENSATILAEKLLKLRIMADKKGKMNLNVSDVGTGILVVSQFTLYADTAKGNRPSFVKAAEPVKAEKLYNLFVEKLNRSGTKIVTGQFGAYMKIETELDGPATILIES